jgi:hypothetical protein
VDSPGELIWVFFAGAMVIVGLIAVFYGVRKLRAIRAAATYEPVPATVESAEVEQVVWEDSPTEYYPDVTYSYTWGTDEFTSDSFSPGDDWGRRDEDEVQAVVDGYEQAVGQQVTAMVDPDDPEDACLELPEEGPREAYRTLGFGVTVVLAALLAIAYQLFL